MKIGPLSNHQPPEPERTPHAADQQIAPTGRRGEDQIDISGEARLRLAEMADDARRHDLHEADASGEEAAAMASDDATLKDGRLEQIRLKILSGYYATPDVVERIAEKLSDDFEDA